MKKVISLLLALVMTLSLCSSALATGIGQEDDKGGNQQESGPAWPTAEQFCFKGTDNDGKTSFFNGTGIDQGRTVTFEKIFKDDNDHKQITNFAVDKELTSKGLTATANDEALIVTVADDCEPGERFVVIIAGNIKYSMCFNVREAGGNQGGGPKWPTEVRFCFKGTDDNNETRFFNGTGIDQGRTVTFEKIFKDDEAHKQITSFAVDEKLTSEGLTATANGEALTVTVAKDCKLGEKFVVIVADNIKYSMCFNVREAGGNQGGDDRQTGSIKNPDQLENDTTKKFIQDYINYVGTDGVFTIKNAEIDATTGLYMNEAARQAAITAYIAFCELGPNADELYSLYVKNSSGQECWFNERMAELRQLADNGSGSYADTNALNKRLRDAGYIAPVLGRDLLLSFPAELRRGEDYDYTYDQSSGHLTITVKKGSAERWLDAAESSFNDDSVLFSMTLVNTKDKALWQFWNGNNDGGTWEQFVDGTMTLEQEKWSEFENGDVLAVVNRENDTMSMTSSADNRNYRVLMIWANEGEEFPNMTKYMYTYEVKVEESFYYERQNVLTVGKVDMSRVTLNELPESWTYDEAESGVLKIWYNGALNGGEAGKVTVKAPDGYTLRVNECSVPNGDKEQLNGNQNGADECVLQLRGQERNTFLLTWENKEGKKKQETLDVFFLQNVLDTLGDYDVNSNGELITRQDPLSVTKPESAAAPTNKQMTLSYNKEEGFFYTSFDYGVLPSYEQMQEGILLTPDDVKGATHFRQVDQSTGDRPRQEDTTAKSLVMGFARMSERETYEIEDPANNQRRTLPYVATEYQDIGGIQVSYAADQGYRYKIVQWLHKEDNGTYTVLGYSYVWGRNDAFINEIQTPGVADGSEAASKEPFVIGEGMQLRCDRYPQYGGDGKIQYFQFRAYGDHEGDYTIYIPYEYFGMSQDDGLALRDRGQRPRINHYYEDHTLRETIVGEYTEYGVKFTTKSFSPFVVDCSTQTTPPRYYYNSTTAADGKQDGGNSPTTFDAGIALYVGMALTSAAGMAWVGKKRR